MPCKSEVTLQVAVNDIHDLIDLLGLVERDGYFLRESVLPPALSDAVGMLEASGPVEVTPRGNTGTLVFEGMSKEDRKVVTFTLGEFCTVSSQPYVERVRVVEKTVVRYVQDPEVARRQAELDSAVQYVQRLRQQECDEMVTTLWSTRLRQVSNGEIPYRNADGSYWHECLPDPPRGRRAAFIAHCPSPGPLWIEHQGRPLYLHDGLTIP